MNSHLTGNPDLEPSVPEQCKRKQRNKRTPKNGAEKPPSRWKKRKKDDEERQAVYTNTDTLMTQLKQVNTHYYITKNIQCIIMIIIMKCTFVDLQCIVKGTVYNYN